MDGLIFLFQVQNHIPPHRYQIRHVVYAVYLRVAHGNPVLNPFLVGCKVPQQFIVLRIQKTPYALLYAVYGKFRADRDFLFLPKCPLNHIQAHLPVGKHIQSLFCMNAQHIQCQLFHFPVFIFLPA